MSDSGRSQLPARRLDAAALERVLARAAELQTATGEPAEELSEEQIFELGLEVGLSSQHLRQALAEERTRIGVGAAGSGGPVARTLGDGAISATRTVTGTPAATLEALDAWMQRQECLQVKRHFPDRIMWEARKDLFGTLRRGLNLGGRGYALAQAHEVSATVVAVDDSRVLVRLDADMVAVRSRYARNALLLSVLSGAGGATAVALGVLLPVAAIPAVALAGGSYMGARRQYAGMLGRAQLALEQVLDRLERGELARGGSLLQALSAAARSTGRLRP